MPNEPTQVVIITAEDFTEDPPRPRISTPHPKLGKDNPAVKARWDHYRRGQIFRVFRLDGLGDPTGEPQFIETYEQLAKALGLSLSTVRQYFAMGGGKFKHVVDGVQVEVTRGRVVHGGE